MACWRAVAAAALLCAAASPAAPAKQSLHRFTLVGGHFFGPGPIVPDTSLPVGHLRNIRFDLKTFSGYAEFANDGSEKAFLSDGKTRINQNIDAGVLDIGGGTNPVLLVAVKGGRNKGREVYRLADDYSMVWTVDLALDPGFAEGIISVGDFILTTGLVKIARSAQSEAGMPGGYDQAGSLKSGHYLAGRVGDFNQDGYMDGIVVAAPRVPLDSNMLPGSPVGNQRGFQTDVEIPPNLASELTLRGIAQFRQPLAELVASGRNAEIAEMMLDIHERFKAASLNIDRAISEGGVWTKRGLRRDAVLLADRLEGVKTLSYVAGSYLRDYPAYDGYTPTSVRDAVRRIFSQMDGVLDTLSSINARSGQSLPKRAGTSAFAVSAK